MVSDAFKVRTVAMPELSHALRGLGSSRASGEDGVTVQMLRATFPVIGPHLLHVINSSLRTGEVPRRWKAACVVPVYKKGDRCDPGNVRPLSINSVPGKLCEKCVCNQLSPYLDQNNVLCDNQHGFRLGHSTETALIDWLCSISTSMENGLITTLLAADTSRAFDSVEHEQLIDKLGWYGVDRLWFDDWLCNRTQRIQGSSAGALPVTHGVVQGSILGPRLFLLFTNDLASHLPFGKQIVYADDVQFIDSDTVENLVALKERVENTLELALKWYTQNRLKINPNKTELLVIKPRKKKCDSHISIRFGDSEIKPTPCVKILGVFIDSALTWEKQVSQVTRRCYSVLVGLSRLRHKLSCDTKKLLVEALVFPHIIYCCTVWGGCSATQKHRIQKTINFAARVVTGLARRDHVTPALEALGWVRFEGMLEKRDEALIRRLLSPDVPPALAQLVQRRSEVTQRSTRGAHSDQLELPKIKTERARRSFPFRAVSAWNCRGGEGGGGDSSG